MLTTSLSGAVICCSQAGDGTAPLRRNVGFHVGDDPVKVTAQRQKLAQHIGRQIIWMNQTHSAHVEALSLAHEPLRNSVINAQGHRLFSLSDSLTTHVDADGIFLDTRNEEELPPALAVMTADCLPVIFADDTGRVVAAVHAGRAGFINGILPATLNRYAQAGIPPQKVSAYIGPAICGRCYEVPQDMKDELVLEHPTIGAITSWGTPSLDLPAAACAQLEECGIAAVEWSNICTAENGHYHSYRRHHGAGRQATIVLPTFSA